MAAWLVKALRCPLRPAHLFRPRASNRTTQVNFHEYGSKKRLKSCLVPCVVTSFVSEGVRRCSLLLPAVPEATNIIRYLSSASKLPQYLGHPRQRFDCFVINAASRSAPIPITSNPMLMTTTKKSFVKETPKPKNPTPKFALTE